MIIFWLLVVYLLQEWNIFGLFSTEYPEYQIDNQTPHSMYKAIV